MQQATDRRERLLVAGTLGAACGFLLFRLARDVSAKPVHEDEALAGLISARPLTDILEIVLGDRGGAPLHFVLVHAAFGVDTSQSALRWVSVPFAVGAVLLCFDLGRRLAGPIAGITAALLATASQLLVVYGSFGRMYALVAFAAALSADLFVYAVDRRTTASATAAAIAAWLLVAAHPYGLVMAAGEAVVGLALWRGRPLRAVLPVAVVAVALLPFLLADTRLAERGALQAGGDTSLATPREAARMLSEGLGGLAGGRGPVFLLFVALVGVGAVALRRRSAPFLVLTAISLLALPLFLVLGRAEESASARLESRHMIYALPFWTALVGAGTARLLAGRSPPTAAAGVAAVVLAAFLAPASIEDPRDLQSGTRAATAGPAARLAGDIGVGAVLFPNSPVFLAGLPEAGRALPLPRGQPGVTRRMLERAPLPAGPLHVAVPLDFAARIDVAALRSELGPGYRVAVSDYWLVVTAPGPFNDHLAIAQAGAAATSAARRTVITSSPRLDAYFRQSLRALCGVTEALGGECPAPR